jgi:predicted RNase H-like nuclease (RuvC/YqgF family)
MSDAVIERDIGRLEGEVQALARTVDRLSEKLEETNRHVSAINNTLAEAKGGWRMLVWLAGASGSIGAALSYLASLLTLRVGA